jgi:hypothetical protein
MLAAFLERVRINQARLTSELKSQYDFIVCGSGSSGCLVARRLAENPRMGCLTGSCITNVIYRLKESHHVIQIRLGIRFE